jgi:hypothetical protein
MNISLISDSQHPGTEAQRHRVSEGNEKTAYVYKCRYSPSFLRKQESSVDLSRKNQAQMHKERRKKTLCICAFAPLCLSVNSLPSLRYEQKTFTELKILLSDGRGRMIQNWRKKSPGYSLLSPA